MTARILIVDDSMFDRRMIRRAINAMHDDMKISELSGGDKAASTIATQKPCLTLLDIRMPGTDGFSVLSNVRNRSDLADSVILMLSGSDEPGDRKMASELGADGYYVKPESAAEYMKLGQYICEHHLPCAQPGTGT